MTDQPAHHIRSCVVLVVHLNFDTDLRLPLAFQAPPIESKENHGIHDKRRGVTHGRLLQTVATKVRLFDAHAGVGDYGGMGEEPDYWRLLLIQKRSKQDDVVFLSRGSLFWATHEGFIFDGGTGEKMLIWNIQFASVVFRRIGRSLAFALVWLRIW